MIMANALLKAGVIGIDDLKRVEKHDRTKTNRQAAKRRARRRYDQALEAMPGELGYEMRDWAEHNGPLPIKVLEQWVELRRQSNGDGYRVIAVEWSKWISVFRDHNNERTAV